MSSSSMSSSTLSSVSSSMSSPMIDLCEQVNPARLREIRGVKEFCSAQRIHGSLTAQAEKTGLIWLAFRTPGWINSDHLTSLGVLAQLFAGISYALARWNRYALFLVILFLALNWLGDSLDGTLARVRNQQRPRYGFYVDHMVDSFGALFLMGGLALSGYMEPALAIALLIAFLLLSIQSYLATYTMGEFHLSFWRFGPTELRILLAVGNLALLRSPLVHFLGHGPYRLFDVGGAVGLAGMVVILLWITATNTARLYREERIS
jgi:archaetidylinositol phosphate synthase